MISDTDLIRYPFFMRIINNLQILVDPIDDDLDIVMLFMYLYWYSCKYLKHNNIELSQLNIYITMERIFKDHNIRSNIIEKLHDFVENQFKLTNN